MFEKKHLPLLRSDVVHNDCLMVVASIESTINLNYVLLIIKCWFGEILVVFMFVFDNNFSSFWILSVRLVAP